MDRRTAIFMHHKCGSTWLCWMMSSLFQQNGVSYYHSSVGNSAASAEHTVSLLQNADYSVVSDHLAETNIHFIRNPLSVLASAYFSHRGTHPTSGWPRLEQQRRLLARCNRSEGLLLTLAFLQSPDFCERTRGPLACLKSWNYDDPRIETIRMEDAVADPRSFLNWCLPRCGLSNTNLDGAEHFLFERFTGRRIGEVDESSHYRSGDPDGWRAELPGHVIDFLRHEFRTLLERHYPASLNDRSPAGPALALA